jgi:hypothetical protein
MLEEEKNALEEEEEEEEEDILLSLENTTHPAVDNNAKWELYNLFKDNIEFPF